MVRINYNLDGERFEEILNARREKLTEDMITSIEDVYIFERDKMVTGELAKRYIRKLQNVYL